jgi:hypothetical protein
MVRGALPRSDLTHTTPIRGQTMNDHPSNTSGAEPGTLALDVIYGGVEPGALIARLSPLAGDSATACPAICAIAPDTCISECHPPWLVMDADTTWPGVSSLYIDRVPPGHYWLFAHVGLTPDPRAKPAPKAPVSRDAPIVIEIRSHQTTSASLELDATFVRGGAMSRRSSGCPLRLDRGPVHPDADRGRGSATRRDSFATCSAADRPPACCEP